MANHTFTATYLFKYRFQCEHCGKMTQWKDARFSEQTTYNSAPLEGKGLRLAAEQKFKEEFLEKKVPELRKKFEEGDYSVPSGMDSKCPDCGKLQSWEKIRDVGWGFGAVAFMAIIALIGWGMFNSGASSGNGKRQLAGLIMGGFGAFGFLLGLFLVIWAVRRKAKIRRDMQNVTVRNKPEFNWPEKQ